jgi:Mg-chelatase subunit ChlD
LAATLGCVSAEAVDEADQQWQGLVGNVTSDRLKETLRRFDEIAAEGISTKAPSDSVRDSVFDGAHLLRLFERYGVVDSWPRRDPISAALRMRGEADRLSVMRLDIGPQEIRGVPWVASAIARADSRRLVLEDFLVAGQAVGGDTIDDRVAAAESAYQDATKRLGEVSRGIAICDDALHRLPYLAEALSILMPESDPTPERPGNVDWVATLVLPAMRDAVSLSRQLDEAVSWRAGQDVDAGVPFAATSERLRAAMEQSDRLLGDWVRSNVAEPELSGRSLLALRSALDLPWLSWQDRRELRKTHDQIAHSLGFIEQSGDEEGRRDGIDWRPGGGEAPTARRLTTLDRILAWPVHPAVLATGVEVATSVDGDGVAGGPAVVPAESGIARVEQTGYLVREALSHWTGDAKSSPWDDPSTSIEDWMGAARWQRRSLALATGTPSNSPLETVWRDRLQWLLLWQADRQLDAFYGTPTPAAAVRTERPFFDHAVDRCLRLVDAVGPVGSGVQEDLVAIKKRQVNRRLASRIGMVVNVSSSPLPVGADVSVNLTVSPGDLGPDEAGQGGSGGGAAGSFPMGHPSVWVKTDTGEPATGVAMFATPLAGAQSFQMKQDGVATTGASAGPASTDTEVSLNPPAPSVAAEAVEPVAGEPIAAAGSAAVVSAGEPDSLPVPVAPRPGFAIAGSRVASSGAGSPRLTAFAVFRGNEFSRSFVANRLGGRIVEYQPHRFGESSITLLGQRRKRASIVFVLDCSRSMEEPLAGESLASGGASRMDSAKAALVEMLDELSRQEGTRIGVVLLGHRVAWTKSDPPRISRSPGAGPDVPTGLMPSRDVETILPLGRFDSGRVLQRLDQVRPWGQTPLYLAVIEALQAFGNDDPDTEKQVIVITDGRDYQFTPPRSDIRQPAKTTMSDVAGTAAQAGVPVFIVGFGLQPEERTAAENDFQQIADATGGETVSVDNASDLLRRIRDRLAPGTFTVTDRPSVGDPAAAGSRSITATLNGTVKIDPRMVDGDTFELVFESASASIPIEGGEALQIGLSPDGREFLPLPFDWQFPTPHDLVVGPSGRQSGYQLNTHRPLRQGDSVVFPVSIRSARDAVTRRPAESWLTVTPVVGGVEMPNERYWFYDVNFEPGQPVPLLKWEARDWPSEANAARLDYWCKFEPTPATEEVPLRQVLENPDAFVGRQLSDFPSVKLQVSVSDRKSMGDLYVVNVIQRHEGQAPDLGQLRAEFRTAMDYRPIRVTHQFDPDNGIVSSTFAFRAADAAGIERSDRSAIALISRSASQADALRLSGGQAVEVEVMRNDDLLLGQPLGVVGQ